MSDTYNFTTPKSSGVTLAEDTSAPSFAERDNTLITSSSAVITWTTSEPATSKVEWGTTNAFGTASTSSTLTTKHSIKISGLSQSTTYYYQIVSTDASGNTATSSNSGAGFTFATIAPETVSGGTNTLDNRDLTTPTILVVEVADITSSSAAITFQTSKVARSTVSYGITEQLGQSAGDQKLYTKSHSVPLVGLRSDTVYYYKITVEDIYNNKSAPTSVNFFKTLGAAESSTTTTATSSTAAFTSVVTATTTVQTTTVTTETAAPRLILTADEERKITEVTDVVRSGSSAFVNKAIQSIFGAISLAETQIDENVFAASVAEVANKLVAAPKIAGSEIKVAPGTRTATVTWTTDKESNSLVSYASAEDYDASKPDPYVVTLGRPDEYATVHTVELSGLEPNTTYHFTTQSKPRLGPTAVSEDHTFTTASLTPDVFDVRFRSINETSATMEWQTSIPTKSKLTVIDASTGKSVEREDPNFVKLHELTIGDLAPATSYRAEIRAVDEEGNLSRPAVLPFSTIISRGPITISQVRISTGLIPDKVETVQAIISWKTDKPGTSRVWFGEGSSEVLRSSTSLDANLVRDHLVVTTALKPGTVYRMQIESGNADGEPNLSEFYTILTPRPKKTAVDLILQNLTDTFGFIKK